MTTFVRVFIYSVMPLILAAGHIYFTKEYLSTSRKVEIFMIYILALGVGASGIGGFFGHVFLSDLVAESIGWEAGSPFQLEMGFANLVLGVLGFMAVERRTDFRTAAIVAVTILGVGATIVHLLDIAATGNLAPGNTVQNFSNIIRPALLIGLTWLGRRVGEDGDEQTASYGIWHHRQSQTAILAAIGASTGFGVGFALGYPLLLALAGAAAAIGLFLLFSHQPELINAGKQ